LAEVVAEEPEDLVDEACRDPVSLLEEEAPVPVDTEEGTLTVALGDEVGTLMAVESDVAVDSVGEGPVNPGHPGTVVFGGARPPPQSRAAIAGTTEARMRRRV